MDDYEGTFHKETIYIKTAFYKSHYLYNLLDSVIECKNIWKTC